MFFFESEAEYLIPPKMKRSARCDQIPGAQTNILFFLQKKCQYWNELPGAVDMLVYILGLTQFMLGAAGDFSRIYVSII